jgi:ABC-type proline/glycine betaine transport system permease subunit
LQLTIISATIAVAIAVVCAWYCRRLALEKGRNVLLWTVLGFALTVIAVPVLVLLLPVSSESERQSPSPDAFASDGERVDLK